MTVRHRARPPAGPEPDGDAEPCTIAAPTPGERLADVQLRDRLIEGSDLANVHVRGLSVRRCAVRTARLTGATLTEAVLQDVTVSECRADLVSLAGAALERVVFADCDLRETAFDEATLHDVRFERCVLDGASFHRARLHHVELLDCDLTRVRAVSDLRGAGMRWPDVVANAAVIAAAAGFTVLDDDPR